MIYNVFIRQRNSRFRLRVERLSCSAADDTLSLARSKLRSCVPELTFFLNFKIFYTIKLKMCYSQIILFMRKRTISTIYLAVGLILSISFPISSVLNAITAIGAYIPYDPLSYWITWLWQYGLFTITLAIIGVYFIRYGYLCRKKFPKAKSV